MVCHSKIDIPLISNSCARSFIHNDARHLFTYKSFSGITRNYYQVNRLKKKIFSNIIVKELELSK